MEVMETSTFTGGLHCLLTMKLFVFNHNKSLRKLILLAIPLSVSVFKHISCASN